MNYFPLLLILTAAVPASAGSKCADYVADIKTACADELLSGRKVGCADQFISLDGALKQSQGKLFDVGDKNAEAGERACAVFNKSLARQMNKVPKGPALVWGAECKPFVARIQAACIEPLGKKAPPKACGQAVRIVTNAAKAHAMGQPEAAEFQCAMGKTMKLE